MLEGGIGNAQSADDEIQEIVNTVKIQLGAHAPGNESKDLKVIKYRTQCVAGTNYFVKVDAGDQHLHLRIYKPLPHTGNPLQLVSVQTGKTLEDEL